MVKKSSKIQNKNENHLIAAKIIKKRSKKIVT